MRILLSLIIATTMVLAQFGKVNVVLDDRLLRDSERQEVFSLRDEITRFFSGRIWDEDFHNLNIPLHISIAFQGVAQKGGLKTFHAQILVNDGMDLRYFDKSIQFYFNPGGAIHFDPVIFDPLGSFLAYYAYTVLAGYMDTYDFYGGNHAYDQAREIALRGIASDFPKGWSSRMQLLKEVTGNKGLREARFAYYVAMDLFNQGNPDSALKEFGFMMNGFKKVVYGFPIGRMQYFLKAHANDISHRLTILGQDESLRYLADIDPENKKIYLKDIKK
jgi:hypothetical protein